MRSRKSAVYGYQIISSHTPSDASAILLYVLWPSSFGILKMFGWRVRKLSATCLGVRPYRSAISASTLPPGLWGEGKFPCPNGEYPTTAIPRFVHRGVCGARSHDILDDRGLDCKPACALRGPFQQHLLIYIKIAHSDKPDHAIIH